MRNGEAQDVSSGLNCAPHNKVGAGPPKGSAGPHLASILEESRWSYRMDPFPHIHVERVFVPSVYNQLLAAFRDSLIGNLKHRPDVVNPVYYGSSFDGYVIPFRPSFAGPLSLFICKAWVDLLARVTGANVTSDVNGALHYHPTGSKNGFIHKDFSSCWFSDHPRPDGINVTDNNLCNYRTGKTTADCATAQERIRAVAMLLYLNNEPWLPGDGGETGLYRTDLDPIDQPVVAVPPINNSMLIFECSPRSYHSFLRNRRNPRSSVVMWLHSTREEAVAKWGAESIVYVRG